MKATRARNTLTSNIHLIRWVEKTAELTKPDSIHWVDGSQAEYDKLCREMVKSGTFTKLSEKLWPGCFLARSDAGAVARITCEHNKPFGSACSVQLATAGLVGVDPFVLMMTSVLKSYRQ